VYEEVGSTVSVFDRAYDDPVRVLDEGGEVVGDVPDPRRRGARRDVPGHAAGAALRRSRREPPAAGADGDVSAVRTGGRADRLRDRARDEDDWMVPSYREHGAALVRGLPLKQTLLYWMGHEAGNATPEGVNVFPVAVPIASQVPHATGAAWASKLRGENDAFLCYFGDGATSEGDFHEGVNFAGVFDTPTVFFCNNNNQWAISVPRERQTRSATLAQKAGVQGIDGVQVDGMDPLAVYSVTKAAVEKARDPETDRPRPTLIEAIQYRFGARTTADDPTVYRDDDEVESWKRKDPIPRLERYLRSEGVLDDERVAEIETAVETRVAEAIEAAESEVRPKPQEMFERVRGAPTRARAAVRGVRGVPRGTRRRSILGGVNERDTEPYRGTGGSRRIVHRDARGRRRPRVGPRCGEERRRLPRDRGPVRRVRRRPRRRHPACRVGDRRCRRRHGRDGTQTRSRDPVFGVHVSRFRPDRLPHGPLPDAKPGAIQPADDPPRPVRWRNSGAGAPLRVEGGVLRPRGRAEGRHPLDPVRREGAARGVDSRDPDPVIFLEPKLIYRAFRGEVPEEPYTVPIGEAVTRREGGDVAVFTYGAMTRPTLEAAETLAEEGIDCEVVDLRTVSPLDREAIIEAFEATGRAVVVHEAPEDGGSPADHGDHSGGGAPVSGGAP